MGVEGMMNATGEFVLTTGGPSLEPGDTCIVKTDGTVARIDPSDLQQRLSTANETIAQMESFQFNYGHAMAVERRESQEQLDTAKQRITELELAYGYMQQTIDSMTVEIKQRDEAR